MTGPLCRATAHFVGRVARREGRAADVGHRPALAIRGAWNGTCSSIARMTDVYDVVVVGSGGGAMTGAFLAQKSGLSTVVLEKTGLLGGTSAYSGGACWLPGSDVQQRAGIADSTESAREYLGAILVDPDEAKVEASLAHAPELAAGLGAEGPIDFEWLPFPEYYDAPGRVRFGRSIQPAN